MVLESHVKLCVTESDFLRKKFCPKNWENVPKIGQKQGLFNLLENVVISFYWIYIIYCVPAQTPYLVELLFLRYGPKCSQPIRLEDFFNQPYLQNRSMKYPDFLHVDTNSHKLKADQKNLGWAWSEMGVASLVTWV